MAKKFFVGNAHLDPAWLWCWQEGYTEVLTTFRSMLDRLKEFPETAFTSACSVYYQWIEETDPAMFEEIRQRVREGRWHIVGGWYLQPDCNMPDAESFLRHSLIAQRYFKEKFGVTATTGYNVDSFGHNAGLPKLLRAGGMENYVFMRPSPEEQGRTERLFRWQSDDGSSVLAYRIPHYYNITMERLHLAEKLSAEADASGAPVMIFCGIGNHGGGPTIELLQAIDRLPYEEKIYDGPDAFFETANREDLPVLTGELQHHARGCYSAMSAIKTRNRKAEQSLLAAEVFSVMAMKLTGAAYPAEELKRGWENVLFNQFHDILCGCSIKPVYEDAANQLGESISLAEKIINRALQRIAWKIDTMQGAEAPAFRSNDRFTLWQHRSVGTPVILFNAHPWPVKQCVQVNATTDRVTDEQGRELPFQVIRSRTTDPGNCRNIIFNAEVPAMGYAVCRIYGDHQQRTYADAAFAAENVLENDILRVELDQETGDLRTITDKRTGKLLLNYACKAVLTDETDCDTWAHDQKDLGPTVDSFCACNFEVLEQGCVRSSIRTTVRCGNSTVARTFSLPAGSDCITVQTVVDYHEQHKALKFTFPMENETVTAKIPCGTVTRVGHTGEEPCGSWIASGNICVANDSKYGYDTCEDEMRMTVLRGAIYANHFGERDAYCTYMDQGIYEFTYCVFPHRSISASERCAAELNFPLRQIVGGFHGGSLPQTMTCLENPHDNVCITAVKNQEDGNGIVLRLCEMEGQGGMVTLKLFGQEVTAQLTGFGLKTVDDSGRTLNAMEWEI